MPTEGELAYYDAIGQAGVDHASLKPFSDPDCGFDLMQVGGLFTLLPPPPARILECGCGTGWLTRLFAQRGYECVGIDVAPKAIELARSIPAAAGPEPEFAVADAETMAFDAEFDAVVFYDALHHSIDEAAVIRNAFRALRPGGVCITSEPGIGHQEASAEVVETYGVTEKDMPASYIIELGRNAGFQEADVIPRFDNLGRFFTAGIPAARLASQRSPGWKQMVWSLLPARLLARRRHRQLMSNLVQFMTKNHREADTGFVVLYR